MNLSSACLGVGSLAAVAVQGGGAETASSQGLGLVRRCSCDSRWRSLFQAANSSFWLGASATL